MMHVPRQNGSDRETRSLFRQLSATMDSPLKVKSTRSSPTLPEEEERLMEQEQDIDFFLVGMALGDGPMRFAGRGERTLERQLEDLKPGQLQCFKLLKEEWEKGSSTSRRYFYLPDEWILRFARNCPGRRPFSFDTAWKAMKQFDPRYLSLSYNKMDKQLLTNKAVFPIPGLRDKEGREMFYIRASRNDPTIVPAKTAADSLCFVLNTMLEKELPARDGIGLIAYMNDWKLKFFKPEDSYKILTILQGHVIPVKIKTFLIVNPPSWFDRVWKVIKPMMSPAFRKKIRIIPEQKLFKYLEKGFERYLPDEMELGQADTDQMVADYNTYREYLDEQQDDNCFGPESRKTSNSTRNRNYVDLGDCGECNHKKNHNCNDPKQKRPMRQKGTKPSSSRST